MRSIIPFEQNPALRTQSADIPVAEITGTHVQTLIKEMKALLAVEKYGVALAAPQVGEAVRLFIVSGQALEERSEAADADDPEKPAAEKNPAPPDQVYINPVLLKVSRGKKQKHEGCLSIKGKWGRVPRAEKATIRAYDESGKAFTRGASGFLAHVFQHEMDHLDGILYTDKATDIYDDDEDGE